jgi:hypothetical protein
MLLAPHGVPVQHLSHLNTKVHSNFFEAYLHDLRQSLLIS